MKPAKHFQEQAHNKHISIKPSCRQQFFNHSVQKGTISKFTTSKNILKYTIYSYSFSFVTTTPNS
jgi:hypothetical protein